MSFYNPYQKSPDFGQGINDFVAKLMQMMMMKQVFGQDKKQEVAAQGEGQLGGPQGRVGGQMFGGQPSPQAQAQGGGPPPGMGAGQMMPPQPPMGAGPPGMAQAGMAQGMAQQMPQLMMAIKNNPQLLQMIMQMINPGGMNQGGMMGGGPR